MQVAGYRYSTQGFYNLSDSAYSRMSGYTVKPPTGDTNEQTQFIDYFNLFYSKRGQEQISISQQLGNYGTTFFSASRQSYYSALSADSVIKISGRVLDYGCTVSSDSLNFTVDLQKNSARQFPTTGSTSPAVPFQITLSECSKGTTGVR
ncbi:TPA: fimbria/pilus outer membrane usher protein, partial [Escherichia coli]